jgi:hypothetical protein
LLASIERNREAPHKLGLQREYVDHAAQDHRKDDPADASSEDCFATEDITAHEQTH